MGIQAFQICGKGGGGDRVLAVLAETETTVTIKQRIRVQKKGQSHEVEILQSHLILTMHHECLEIQKDGREQRFFYMILFLFLPFSIYDVKRRGGRINRDLMVLASVRRSLKFIDAVHRAVAIWILL